jgi:gas vesicle protein
MKKASKSLAIGTFFAAIAGYIAGILTAPKSGKETRKDIKETAAKSISVAEKELKQLHTELSELIASAKEMASKLSGNAKVELNEAIEKSKQAKEKAREILSAVHEGDTDDKDLKKAIDDSKKAASHLKDYLKKI